MVMPPDPRPSRLRHPFLKSLILLGFAVLCFQASVFLFQQRARGPGLLAGIIGFLLVLAEVAFYLPVLVRNALGGSALFNRFRVTSGGWVFILLLLLVSLSAINTGNNLLYILLSFMIASILASGVLSHLSLARLLVSVDYQDSIFAGEPTEYRLRLVNQKRLTPAFSIAVEGLLVNETWDSVFNPAAMRDNENYSAGQTRPPTMRTVAYFAYLPPKGREEELFTVRFSRRGVYCMDGMEVTTAFPFGFFRKGRRVPGSGRLMVYPRLCEESVARRALDRQFDTLPVLFRGIGSDIHSLRGYEVGDDIRHVHWKASARVGHLIVKEFSVETRESAHFLLDETVDGDPKEFWNRFDRAVSMIATIVVELHGRGWTVQVWSSHPKVVSSSAETGPYSALRLLTVSHPRLAPPHPSGHAFNRLPPENLLEMGDAGGVVLCSFHDPSYFPGLVHVVDNFLDLSAL